MILGKVLAELTNTPDLLYSDEHAAFRKFGDNADADDEMPEWANEASGAHKDSTSDAEHEHRERVTWKKMKDRPGHHRRYQTRRQKREPGAEILGLASLTAFRRCRPRSGNLSVVS